MGNYVPPVTVEMGSSPAPETLDPGHYLYPCTGDSDCNSPYKCAKARPAGPGTAKGNYCVIQESRWWDCGSQGMWCTSEKQCQVKWMISAYGRHVDQTYSNGLHCAYD